MPPKPKYSREEVAKAAFELIKTEGLMALTARELGKRLGTSASPIFTIFRNMEEVKQAARELALEEFKEYISDYKEYTPAFKRIGMMIVSYGIHEPELFKLLFMQEHEEIHDFQTTLREFDDLEDVCIEVVEHDYSMTKEQAKLLFEQMWTQAYGLGVMCAMRVCNFTEEEIGKRLGIMFASLAMFIKSGKADMIYGEAEKNPDGIFHGRLVGNLPFESEKQGGEAI